jgi:hypothetical protein
MISESTLIYPALAKVVALLTVIVVAVLVTAPTRVRVVEPIAPDWRLIQT